MRCFHQKFTDFGTLIRKKIPLGTSSIQNRFRKVPSGFSFYFFLNNIKVLWLEYSPELTRKCRSSGQRMLCRKLIVNTFWKPPCITRWLNELTGYFHSSVSKSFTENNRNKYLFEVCAYQDPFILLLIYFELIPIA